jgi:hypothetical protein
MKEVNPWKTVRLVLMMLFAPPIITSCSIALSHLPHLANWGSPVIVLLAFTLSILIGLFQISRLPIKVEVRIVLGLVYVPTAGYFLVIYSLYFEGIAFNNWL